MIQLRPLQEPVAHEIRAALAVWRAVLLYAPCGFGKTVIFCWIAWRVIQKGGRIVLLVHRDELLAQVSETLDMFGVPHTFCAAGYPYDSRFNVVVASVMSLVTRLDRIAPPTICVADEAHHCVSGNSWGKIFAHWPNAKILGVSATPCRADRRGLGEIFQHMVLGPSTRRLIEEGWLSPYRLFAPPTMDTSGLHMRAGDFVRGETESLANKPHITGDCITHYRKLADGKSGVVFCTGIQHAKAVAEAFCTAGYRAVAVDGEMDRQTRRDVVRDYAEGRVQVLTSTDLISEGFNIPRIEIAMSLRPTASEGLWIQQVGRALRICPGKTTAIICDHSGNSQRLGLPDEDRTWSLEGGLTRTADRAASHKRCAQCFAVTHAGARACPDCGAVFTTAARTPIKQIDGDLEEVEAEAARKTARTEQGMAQTLSGLIELGKLRGYRNPEYWARAVERGRKSSKRG